MEYFKIEDVPGKTYFRCERYSATLSTDACAAMWRKANHENAEAQFKCRVCPLGAVHAGETAASMSPFKGTTICARCHRMAPRLIRKHLCVSCWNRERELIVGRNAKGTKPVRLRPLHRRRVFCREGDGLRTIEMDMTAATDEIIVATLRDAAKLTQFAFRGEVRGRGAQLRVW